MDLSHWIIFPQTIDGLKDATRPPFSAQPIVTENSIISARIWRHVTRAKQRAGIKVGNAIIMERRHTTAAGLASDSEGSLYEPAHQIVHGRMVDLRPHMEIGWRHRCERQCIQ